MRTNSADTKAKNNLHDPTLRDHERENGVSGEAIQGEHKAKGSNRLRTESR